MFASDEEMESVEVMGVPRILHAGRPRGVHKIDRRDGYNSARNDFSQTTERLERIAWKNEAEDLASPVSEKCLSRSPS